MTLAFSNGFNSGGTLKIHEEPKESKSRVVWFCNP